MSEGSCIHPVLEAVAAAQPGKTAAVCGQDSLTYGELHDRANRLAHRLVDLGVGPETRVGIMLRPSLDLAVAVLGVLKSGGAYVPLDPNYPPDRLSFMIDDADLGHVVATEDLAEAVADRGIQVVSPDTESDAAPSGVPDTGVEPHNAAYVIYTSGSTGTPKGVVVEHRGIEVMARNSTDVYRIRPDSRVLQWASFNFDAAACDFFATWIVGATLVLASADEKAPGPALARLVRAQKVNIFWTTPTVLAATPTEDLDTLVTIGSVGEACTSEMVDRWTAGGRHFVNGYGPTEYTVFATAGYREDNIETPSIGRPLEGVELFLVDPASLEPVAPGETGEILLGGIQVARGYLNSPELTRERFITNPLSPERMYRTGDLARQRPDGALEFIGRADDQVKIRGYRIELGEIEGTLASLPGVAAAAVRLADDGSGGERILGYWISANGRDPRPGDLLDKLRKELPGHMVPQQLIQVESFPRTPNGKLDRDALPLPALDTRDAVEQDYRSDTERVVAAIWSEVLVTSGISRNDGFMDLGGHSLAAVRVLELIHEHLQVALEPRILLTEPLFEVARRIDVRRTTARGKKGFLGRIAARVGIR